MGLCNLSVQIGVKHELNTSRKFHVRIINHLSCTKLRLFFITFCLESFNQILELLFHDKRLYQLSSFYYFVGLQMLLSFG